MTKSTVIGILIGLILFIFPQSIGGAFAQPSQTELHQIRQSSISNLLSKAEAYFETHPDSAIIYNTAITNRYSPSMSKSERSLCLKATLNLWELEFFNRFDYTASFESLAKAKEISEGLGNNEPRIDLGYGCMYFTVYEQSGDYETGVKAYSYLTKAFDTAIEKRDILTTRMAFGNLSELASRMNRLNDIKERATRFRHTAEQEEWTGREFDLGLYEVKCMEALGDYEQSEKIYHRLLRISETPGLERYQFVALQGIINACLQTGQFSEALSLIKKAERELDVVNLRDGRLILLNLQAKCYDSIGNHEQARQSMAEYVILKDSLLSYNQASTIKSIEYVDEIRKFDRQLTEARQKRHKHMVILAVTLLSLVVVGTGWINLRRKNKALKSANESLYRKNQELLHLEAEAIRMRDIVGKTVSTDSNNIDSPQKYKGSRVTDDLRESLWQSIMETLDHSPEIYDPDFSLSRLAELCDSKAKYVSQVINEKGDNFKTLINTRRIHQACREITASAHLTIEGIANNVGFRSTNAFRTSFKRVTGLTPAEFMQLSKHQLVIKDE